MNGHPLPVAVCDKDRSSTGTTVTLEDFMYTMPVRRKRIDEIFDIQGIRIQLEHLAIVHHDVSIVNMTCCFQNLNLCDITILT